jgi:hypothetical protein
MHNMAYCIQFTMNYSHSYVPPTNSSITPHFKDINVHDVSCNNATLAWYLEGLDDSEINANFWNINITNFARFSEKCVDIYGSCDNSTVLPYCPSCIGTTLCEDTSTDCANYLGQCQNPAYRKYF